MVELLLQSLATVAFIIFLCQFLFRRSRSIKSKPPEPSGALPIIGHLFLLKDSVPLCRSLGAVADKYGPVFMLRLGVTRALVVSSLEVTKECLTTHDKVFASHPPTAAAKYLGYNYAFLTFAPYGSYWREMKKTVTLKLLSKNRLDMLQHIRKGEVDACIQDLYSYWVKNRDAGPVSVEMDQWFSRLNFNVLTKMIAGKRYLNALHDAKDDNEALIFERLVEEYARLSGNFVPSDVVPFIEWMDLQGHLKVMKSVFKEVDSVLGKWLEDHLGRHRNKQKSSSGDDEPEDFIDLMLSIFPDQEDLIHGYHRDTVIKATVLTLIVGGTDTTFIALTWALSLVLNHPNVLKRAQDELDANVGQDRNVDDSDIKNLVYLQAIAKETLRLYPPAPILPHQATEDCQVGGYDVTRGTNLFLNIWKLQRDPSLWSDPEEFQPERFLTNHADVDFKAQQHQYLPFSAGRRQCPGITLAMQIFHLTLARLLHGFDIMTPLNAPVDMTEALSLTLPKAKPLQVLLVPRLPSKLYENCALAK